MTPGYRLFRLADVDTFLAPDDPDARVMHALSAELAVREALQSGHRPTVGLLDAESGLPAPWPEFADVCAFLVPAPGTWHPSAMDYFAEAAVVGFLDIDAYRLTDDATFTTAGGVYVTSGRLGFLHVLQPWAVPLIPQLERDYGVPCRPPGRE